LLRRLRVRHVRGGCPCREVIHIDPRAHFGRRLTIPRPDPRSLLSALICRMTGKIRIGAFSLSGSWPMDFEPAALLPGGLLRQGPRP
jgi:hypothetical protein